MAGVIRVVDGVVVEDTTKDPVNVNSAAIGPLLAGSLNALTTIINGPATMTAAQLTNAVKAEALALRRLIRLATNVFDGTD